MPIVRRVRILNGNEGSSSASSAVPNASRNVSTITSLQRQCAEKGLPTHGRRNALISRLQHHANAANISRPSTSSATEETQPPLEESQPLLSEAQLAQIQSIMSRCVEQSVAEIASNAARAAVQTLSTSMPHASGNNTANSIPIVPAESEVRLVNAGPSESPTNAVESTRATHGVPYGNGFHEVPVAYVTQIQSGEFFELAKLLSANMSMDEQADEPIVLTIENSVIKAKKVSLPTARITDVEQWTTAFILYISVMTHQFPGRAQELLQYMSLIRQAAQTHPGLGWCIYDHKFRRKAALNPSLDWSIIDQQLWLMIFTISPDVLAEQYPYFSNGHQNQVPSGDEQRGFCNEFNRVGQCSRQSCQYRHSCNRCYQPHPGCSCPSIKWKQVDEKQTSKRGHKSSRSRRD